jgi:hypothetical protein
VELADGLGSLKQQRAVVVLLLPDLLQDLQHQGVINVLDLLALSSTERLDASPLASA